MSPENIECLLLTGGQSRRMGTDKASLTLDGESMAVRIAKELTGAVSSITVLGREPIEGFAFQADAGEFEGPLAALGGYEPKSDVIFVAACDLPRFDPRIVAVLGAALETSPGAEAALPVLERQRQPLCALYRRSAWRALQRVRSDGRNSLMAWLDALKVQELSESELESQGLDPEAFRSANTPEEWKRITGTDLV